MAEQRRVGPWIAALIVLVGLVALGLRERIGEGDELEQAPAEAAPVEAVRSPPVEAEPPMPTSEALPATVGRDPHATVLVEGVVVDNLGGPIEAASVSVRDSAAPGVVPIVSARTDDRGHFGVWLQPGPSLARADRVWLSARAEGYAEATVVVLTPARGVRIGLFPESSLAGIVETEAGEPVADVLVELRPPPLSLLPSPPVAVSDHDGRFEVHNLAPGSYGLRVADRRWFGEHDRVEVGLFERRDDVRIVVVAGHQVRVDVRAPDGSPCPGARAWIPGLDRRSDVPHADGSLSLAAVPAGKHRLFGACPGALEVEQAIEVTGDETFTLTTREGLAIRGRVLDDRDEPVAGARVIAEPPKVGLAHDLRSTTTDERGEFELGGLAPGRFSVSASRSDRLDGEPASVTLSEAEPPAEVELRLARGSCIRGRVDGGPDSLLVVAGTGQRSVTSLRLPDDREFELCGFEPEGEGKLWLEDPGARARVPFVHDGNTLTELELRFPDAAARPLELRVDASPDRSLRVEVDADADALVRLGPRFGTEPLRGCERPWPISVLALAVTSDGAATLEGLYPGRYYVHAEADGAQACALVQIDDDPTTLRLSLER